MQGSLFDVNDFSGGRIDRRGRINLRRPGAVQTRRPLTAGGKIFVGPSRADQLSLNFGRAGSLPVRAGAKLNPAAIKAAAGETRSLGRFLRGKRGLVVGGGALAFGMYEMGKNRSTGRNGIQPGSSGGLGY